MDTILESTTFWVAIAFVLFWLLAYRPIAKAIASWLDGKIARVRTDIDAAAALRREAQQLLSEAQSRLAAATKEAADMVSRAKSEAKQVQEQSQQDISAALAARETQAMQRIALAEQQAVKDIQKLAASAAIEATRTLLQQSDTARLTDDAIAAIGDSKAA